MNTNRLSILSLLILASTLRLTAQEEIHFDRDMEELICKEQERANFRIQQQDFGNAFSDQTDIYYQVMRWEIDPAINYVKGDITYYFKSKTADLTQLHLDLSNSLQVTSVQSNGSPLSFVHSDDQLLTIELGLTLPSGQSDSLTVSYEGVPPSNGFGSFEQGTHNNDPIIWTLSEPYGVRDWWPGKQDLVDKIDSLDVFITTPAGQLAASNGVLVDITEHNGQLVHHWKHRHPIASYLVALAVTNYAAYSHYLPLDNGDTIEILNYVYPETLSQSQTQTESALDIMSLYNELFGTYPFADEKYGHAQFGWGGGMEHQTMSFMGGFSFGLIAHEMAHQWFGDKVTCGSWADIWLNEGFATYLTGLTYQRYSPDQYWPQWKTSTSNSAMSQPGGSVYVDDTTSVNRIFSGRLTYNKGAYLLHMLRWTIGDEAFFAACQEYLNSPGTAYDFGHTEELQAYLEANSGKDLTEFFQDWFYGQGYPSYNLKWTQQADSLIFWLNQTTSHTSVSFFEMPVPVVVGLNGIPQTFVLEHSSQDQRFAFYTDNQEVTSIAIDPDLWLLSKNNTVTEVITATGDPDAQSKYLLYPNPANQSLQILPGDQIGKVEFMDAYGRSWETPRNANSYLTDHLPSGFYTIRLWDTAEQILSVQPIIIVH